MKEKSLKINVVLNLIKQFCALVFPMITFPYVTRVLHSTNYGKVNFAITFVSYFALFASLGINVYAVREGSGLKNDSQKLQKFANQIFTINVISTVLSYVLLAVVLICFRKLDSYRYLIAVCSVNIVFTTLGCDWLNTIHEDFLFITVRYIITHVVSLIMILTLVRSEHDTLLYSVLYIFPTVAANIFNLVYIRKYASLKLVKDIDLDQHLKPVMILFANSLMISLYMNCDITMLGFFKDDTEVGLYSVAVKVYSIVKQMLNAVVLVTIPRFSAFLRNNETEKYNDLFNKIIKSLTVVIIPAVVGLFALSSQAVQIINGSEYIRSSSALKILSIALFFAVESSMFTQCVLIPYRMEKVLFKATLISAVLNIVLNLWFIPAWSYNGAAVTTLLAEMTMFIICIISIRGKVTVSGVFNIIMTSLAGALPIAVICFVTLHFIENVKLCALIAIPTSMVAYFVVLVLTKNEIFYSVIKKLKRS